MPKGNEWHDRRVQIRRDPTFTPLQIGDKPVQAPAGDTTARRLRAATKRPETLEEWLTHLRSLSGSARTTQLLELFKQKHPLYAQLRDKLLSNAASLQAAASPTDTAAEEFVLQQPVPRRNASPVKVETEETETPAIKETKGTGETTPVNATVIQALEAMQRFRKQQGT